MFSYHLWELTVPEFFAAWEEHRRAMEKEAQKPHGKIPFCALNWQNSSANKTDEQAKESSPNLQ